MPASIFQSINPIYIILLAPFFAMLWVALGKRGLEPSAPAKFGIALLQMGFANLVLVWGAMAVGIDVMVPVLFVFLYYLFATTAELCLSPVGLSAMNRLAPSFMASLIMGAWFYMTAVGNFVAGKIGEATGGRWRRDDQAGPARHLRAVRLDHDRHRGRRPGPVADRQALDAPRHAAGRRRPRRTGASSPSRPRRACSPQDETRPDGDPTRI